MLVKLRRLLLLLISLLLIIALTLWYMLMQPVMGSISKSNDIETFSPVVLENTVRTLVEVMSLIKHLIAMSLLHLDRTTANVLSLVPIMIQRVNYQAQTITPAV